MKKYFLILVLFFSQLASAEVINGITVPPEPDAKLNKSTILGIDKDKNGIRDDIDRMIATYYAKDKKYLDAANYYAKSYQEYLSTPNRKTAVKFSCIKFILDQNLKQHSEVLRKRVVNTPEREKAIDTNTKKLLTSLGGADPFRTTIEDECERPSFAKPAFFNFEVPANFTMKIKNVEIPPAPDEELNNAKIEGIDSNSNGVRDDVERAIAFNFGNKELEFEAAMHHARALQSFLVTPNAKTEKTYVRSVDCARDPAIKKLLDKVEKVLINTNARSKVSASAMAGMILGAENCNSNSPPPSGSMSNAGSADSALPLPPEPDPKLNNASLEGVDSNKDGIRDDIERRIGNLYKNNKRMLDAAVYYAKNEQKLLINPDRQAWYVKNCAALILDETIKLGVREFGTYNTPERVKAIADNLKTLVENKENNLPVALDVGEDEDCERPYFANPNLFSMKVPKDFTAKINGAAVPPEVDTIVGNATVEGIDTNKNGVRDDVERAIAYNFEIKKREYFYLLEFAKAYQALLISPNPTNESNYLRAINCTKRNNLSDIQLKVVRVIENTDVRRAAAKISVKKGLVVPNEPCTLQY